MKTITSSRLFYLPVVLMLGFVFLLVLTTIVSSEAPKNIKAGKAKEAIRMFDVGLGPRTFNFQLGRETKTQYLGASLLQQAVQAGQLQPRTMVSDDFNGDGMGDLVIGYANNGAGVLGMRKGNVQAIAPSDPSVFQAITQGRYPSPFLPEVKLYQLPEAPDFLQFGDFNSDGYADVMAAARGGQRMYLLAGDGRGNLGDPESIEVAGLLTEMRAATQQLGTFTQLAVGLLTPGGASLAVYNERQALASGPESYSMTGEVTGLAFDQLDGDGITDLAAATSSEVVVIHGRTSQPIASADSGTKSTSESTAAVKSAFIERQNFPSTIRGLATGDFAFDRNHQREIAVLSEEGTVYLSARGTPDTRPFTKAEKETISKLRRSFAQDKIDMETLTAEINKLIRPNRATGWNVAETMAGTSPYTGTGKALFQRSNASSAMDELLIGDGINNSVEVVRNERDAAKLNIESTQQSGDSKAVLVAGAPIAAVSMRLSVGVAPGMVLLGADQTEPTIVLAPTAVFTVNSTADLPDSIPTAANGVCQASNGLCTLRAAIMQSNHTGGSNTIMVPDGTYTLTLGPPDDEANTGGATEQSGDLDIFSWDGFDGSPILNAVSITGGTRDGCIIQMGTLSPTLGLNVPNNKERILEVNDVVVIGFHRRINVTLTNLTMQNGYSPTGSGSFLEGGAIYYDGSAQDNTNIGLLTLTNVKLSGNTSAGQGGGVWAGFGSLTINSTSIVRANTATNQSGGGVAWTGGNTVETQALNIANSTIGGAALIDGNQANDPTFGAPGGVDARGGLSVTISGSTIQNNIADVTTGTIGGGGIQINSPTVAISNTTISNNKSKSNAGGIFSSARNAVTNASSTITLTTVDVLANQADSDNSGAGDGGGIFNYFGSMTIQTNSHIDGNSAVNGGGIFAGWTGIPADPTAGLTVNTNSTIGQAGAGNGNSARNNGGSININPVGATLFNPINLTSLTFTNNTANSDSSGGGDGGAIFVGAGQLTSLNNCTIDGNVANLGTGDGIRQTGGTITAAGTLNVNGGDSISLSGGTFTSTPGILNLTGNLLNSGGNFVHNSGTVVCNGSAAQTIGGSTAMTFNNLTINNAAGVNLGNNETVAGTLTLTSGVLGVGTNTLTLTGPVSFTSGTIGSSPTGTVNYNQVAGGQNVAPGNYGNLTFNNSAKVLPNGLTVGIAGTFTTGAGVPTITGSTVDFNGAGAQTIPVFNYNNLTSSNVGARTLAAGTIGVAGTFNPGTNTYTITGNTMDFNGAGAQTVPAFNFNNLTISNTHGANPVTLVNGGTIGVAGTFTPGTSTFVITGNTMNFNGAGAQTIPVFNYNNLTSSNVGARTLAAGTIGVAGTFTPGTNTYTTTGNTMDFNGAGAQTVPAFNFNNLTISNTHGANPVTLVNGGTIGVAGTFSPGTSTFVITGNTVNFNGAGAQTIPAFNFNNLTVSNTHGANAVTLVNGGTIGVAGTFTPGTSTFTIANNTMDFNGTGTQTVAAGFSYHHLTISGNRGGAAITLASGNINVAGTFNPSASNNTWVNTGNTITFNGTATQTVPAFDFFGGFTLNNSTGANLGGNVIVNAALTLTSGALGVGTNTLTLNGAVSATGGSLTSGTTGTVNYNQGSNGQATVLAANYGNLTFSGFNKTLAPSGTIGIAGTFTPGAGAAHTITGSTINFNGAGTQTIPGFTYNNLTSSSGAAARTLDPVNTIKIAGVFTPGTNVYTITGSTVEYNGSSAQVLPSGFTTYNNLTLNNPAGTTGFAGLTVQGLLLVQSGTFTSSSNYNDVTIAINSTLAATAASTINVTGNWSNNGAFNSSTGTVVFNGSGAQTIGGTAVTIFNNLTIANAGSGVALGQNTTVNGVLTLTNDLTTGANALTMPASGTSAGAGDVVGNVLRTGFVSGGSALSFGNPFNSIKINSGAVPTNISITLAKSAPVSFPSAVQRTYTITPNGAHGPVTLRLHYLDSELNGNTPETSLNLRRFNGTGWSPFVPTAADTTDNWLENNAVTTLSPWTFSTFNPSAANGIVSGRILDIDGAPVVGTVVRLSGSQSRKTITNAQGDYRFDSVETNGFYTVTPARANYNFSPANRSFNQLAEKTEAAFTGSFTGESANALDTAEYFVRQQYVDLLGREPDESGFNYWSDRILECGSDARCVNGRRRDVAAAFFIEQEFQRTGSFIYGLYKGSLSRRPLYTEFSADRQQVVEGPAHEATKQAFAESFVSRAEFASKYQGNNSGESFVDALLGTVSQSSGIDLSNQRANLVSRYNAGANLVQSRSFVLRDVIDNAGFRAAEYNRAFVLAEYFGYLQRDPDQGGFDFWLDVVSNRDVNNYRSMVCAFISSPEYQRRFSSIVSRNDRDCGQ